MQHSKIFECDLNIFEFQKLKILNITFLSMHEES